MNHFLFLDWDDAIESDGQEFVTLEEGDYIFTVTSFERGRFPGGPKIPACNKAALTLQVKTPEGIAVIRTDLLLYKTMEYGFAKDLNARLGLVPPEALSGWIVTDYLSPTLAAHIYESNFLREN